MRRISREGVAGFVRPLAKRQKYIAASARCGVNLSYGMTAANGSPSRGGSGNQSWCWLRPAPRMRCSPSFARKRVRRSGQFDGVNFNSPGLVGLAIRMTAVARASGIQKISASFAPSAGSTAKSQPPAPLGAGDAGVQSGSKSGVGVVGVIFCVAPQKFPGSGGPVQIIQMVISARRAPIRIDHGFSRKRVAEIQYRENLVDNSQARTPERA